MGGISCEREISLMSGQNVLDALLRKKINAYPIDVGADIIEQLQTTKPDRAFIALHGINGEDGVIQSILEILNIPYATSGVAACALTIDKYCSNVYWKSLGLPVLSSMILHGNDDFAEIVKKFGFPLCVKPVNNGSACGVTKITDISQLPQAYEFAKQYDFKIMVQPWIEGREFTIGILGEQVLPIVEIVTPEGEFYDYDAKYFKQNTGHLCPCDLSKTQQQEMQNIALKAFQTAECRYWGRVDFMQDRLGKPWLLEVNTIPGMTIHSNFPIAAKQIGIDFDELIVKILEFTLTPDPSPSGRGGNYA